MAACRCTSLAWLLLTGVHECKMQHDGAPASRARNKTERKRATAADRRWLAVVALCTLVMFCRLWFWSGEEESADPGLLKKSCAPLDPLARTRRARA